MGQKRRLQHKYGTNHTALRVLFLMWQSFEAMNINFNYVFEIKRKGNSEILFELQRSQQLMP